MAGLLEKRREDRDEAEIPTAGMADIAFLLLIFFLVTTTINTTTGIGMTLPPKLEDQKPPPVKDRNLMNVRVNDQGELLIEDEQASIQEIRSLVKRHVTNFGQESDLSVSPSDAVISIKTGSGTPYEVYINVLDEVWMAYREIWNSMARSGQMIGPNGGRIEGLQQTYESYQAYYNTLEPGEENLIREALGANISIAEPPEDD